MIKYENQCVECGLPCLQTSCPWTHVEVHYCDECEKNEADYTVGDSEFCAGCLDKIMNKQLEGILEYLAELFAKKPLAAKAEVLGINAEKI